MTVLAGDILAPIWGNSIQTWPTTGGYTMDDGGERGALIFQAPKAGDISKIYIAVHNVVTAPGASVDVRLETVSSSGEPTGTLADTNSNGSITISSGDAGELKTATLTSAATVTKGQWLAAVVQPPDSPNEGNWGMKYYGEAYSATPYCLLRNTGGGWTHTAWVLCFDIEYSDGSKAIIPGVTPCLSTPTRSYHANSTNNHNGALFNLNADASIVGAFANSNISITQDFEFRIYSGTSTLEKSVVFDRRHAYTQNCVRWMYFATPFSASASTDYRLTVWNPSTTQNVNIYGVEVMTSNSWKTFPRMGIFNKFYRSYADDLGGWTDVTTEVPNLGLIIRSFS